MEDFTIADGKNLKKNQANKTEVYQLQNFMGKFQPLASQDNQHHQKNPQNPLTLQNAITKI